MMTKIRKIILIPALSIVCMSGFFSCGVDRWPEYAHLTALDTWMYDIMQENYLWYQELPPSNDLNLFLDPASFLSKVKSKNDNYSFVDSVMETPLPGYGFDYSLVRNPDIDTAYNALITYVIPGSPAALAGLERGKWIVKVDTSYISRKYEEQLLQGTEPLEVTLGVYQKIEPADPPAETEEEEEEDIYRVVPTGEPVKIGAAVSLADNPVHYKTILPYKEGEVGYLMYNSFIAGTKDDAEKYNNELRAWSEELAQKNIHKVILDLRYNKGGEIDCVQLLGTILVPSFYLGETMAFLEYNDRNREKDTTLTFDSGLLAPSGKNLDISTLILLVSGETAGAPEMLMHCLNGKVRQLVTVGSSTKGQNVATQSFVNEEFLWAVNPVVCTIYNSEHDTYPGFQATYSVNASTDYVNFKPFGDPDETLLSVALGFLNGTYPPAEETGRDRDAQHFKIEKSVQSPSSRVFAGGNGLRIK